MASENQSINKRSTRLGTAIQINISSVTETAELNRMEEFVQMPGMKRKADVNLTKQGHGAKRFALGNLTNAESENGKAQKLQKGPIPTAKGKESSDSNVGGTQVKGVAKILTRAATRLARNLKQQQSKQEKQEGAILNEASSSLSNDFAKINVDGGTVPKHETTHNAITVGTSGKETKLCSTNNQQKHQSELGLSCDEKKAKLTGSLDVKPRTRLSSDFELSDNSLYVTAIENQDEEGNSSAAMPSRKTIKSESSIKQQALLLQLKTEKGPEKLEAPIISKHVIRGISINNEQKKNVDARKKADEFESSDDSFYISAIDSLEAYSSSGQRHALPIGEQEKHVPNMQLNTEHHEQQDDASIRESTVIVSFPAGSALINDVEGRNGTVSTLSPPKRTPPGVEDFDKLYWNDINQVSEYAQDIFEYLRQRESAYVIKDYMEFQPSLSRYMRALLVDWMVEIQESFELNHETLYLAVKIVDTYLSKVVIDRATLQLVAAAALLIAAKYDERVPPTVDDFIYVCDGAYERRELLNMERSVFRTIGYDLGFPLSYRFLRRYARVIKTSMPVLTLARYALEASLMEYATVFKEDSKLACAALFVALRMSKKPGWNKALEYYTGYQVNDFKEEAIMLNNGLWPRKSRLYKLNNVRDKYSHELFFKVSKIPVIYVLNELFDSTDAVSQIPADSEADSEVNSAKTISAKNDASNISGINDPVSPHDLVNL